MGLKHAVALHSLFANFPLDEKGSSLLFSEFIVKGLGNNNKANYNQRTQIITHEKVQIGLQIANDM
jgi:hypothetical protein